MNTLAHMFFFGAEDADQARQNLEEYIEISKSNNISKWSEEIGAQSAAKAILDFRQALIWPDGADLWDYHPRDDALSQRKRPCSPLPRPEKRQCTISSTNAAAPASLKDSEAQSIQHTECGSSSSAGQNSLHVEDAR